MVLLFADELLPQQVRRLDRQAVVTTIVDNSVGGNSRSYSSTFNGGASLSPPLLLLREVIGVFIVVASRPTNHSDSSLARHHLGIAAALHSLLNTLRRDAFL